MATFSTRQRGNNEQPKEASTKKGPVKSEASTSETKDEFWETLKSQYNAQLSSLRELFSETWNDEDLLSVLQEVQGDLEIAISRISEGHAQQWTSSGTKKSKKDSKQKSSSAAPGEDNVNAQDKLAVSAGSADNSKGLVTARPTRGRDPGARGRGRRARGGRVGGGIGRSSAPREYTGTTYGEASVEENKAHVPVNLDSSIDDGSGLANSSSVPADSIPNKSAWGSYNKPVEVPKKSLDELNRGSTSILGNSSSSVSAAAGWGASTSPVITSKPVPAPAPAPLKKGTWAQIAKPEVPVSLPSTTSQEKPKQIRSKSPQRSLLTKNVNDAVEEFVDPAIVSVSEKSSTVPNLSQQQVQSQKDTYVPPGFVSSSQTSPTRKQTPGLSGVASGNKAVEGGVVMPNNVNVPSIGVQFGSLSLSEADKAVNSPISHSRSTVGQGVNGSMTASNALPGGVASSGIGAPGMSGLNPYLMGDTSFAHLYGAHFAVGVPPGDFSVDATSNAAAGSSNVPQSQNPVQSSMGSGYPNMNNVGYAPFYHYYMPGQFGNPYAGYPGSSGFGQNKFPMGFPSQQPVAANGVSGGVAPASGAGSGQRQSVSSQGSANKPVASSASQNMYSGYYTHDDSEYAKYMQQQQQGPNPSSDVSRNPSNGPVIPSGNASSETGKNSDILQQQQQQQQQQQYYNQFMHPYGYMGNYGFPPAQGRQQQQPWNGNNQN